LEIFITQDLEEKNIFEKKNAKKLCSLKILLLSQKNFSKKIRRSCLKNLCGFSGFFFILFFRKIQNFKKKFLKKILKIGKIFHD